MASWHPFLFLALVAALFPFIAGTPVLPLALLVLTFLFSRDEIGLRPTQWRLSALGLGLTAGVAMAAIRMLILLTTTHARVITNHTATERTALVALLALLSSVVVEELLFRGYLFLRAVDFFGMTKAMALFAILFGVYHWAQLDLWRNPAMMALVLLSTGTAHVLFAWAFLRTNSLYLPVGIHLGWNWAIESLLGPGYDSFIIVAAPPSAVFVVSYALIVAAVFAMRRIPIPAPRPATLPVAPGLYGIVVAMAYLGLLVFLALLWRATTTTNNNVPMPPTWMYLTAFGTSLLAAIVCVAWGRRAPFVARIVSVFPVILELAIGGLFYLLSRLVKNIGF